MRQRRTRWGGVLALAALLGLSACAGGPSGGASSLTAADRGRVQFAMLDGVNALREARGAPPLALDSALNAAAATHARDMAAQNRPWHFGSDGSSPPERAARAGYPGAFRGEAISESFEGEVETLAAWMEEPGARGVVLDPLARDMGLGWHEEASGKLWWALVTGTRELAPEVPIAAPPRALGPAIAGVSPEIAPEGVTVLPASGGASAPAPFPLEPPVAPPAAASPLGGGASGRLPPPGLRG